MKAFKLTLIIISMLAAVHYVSPMKRSPESYTISHELDSLLSDMMVYKFKDWERRNQAGDLFEHSMWVHYAAQHLIETNSPYVLINLSARDKKLLVLAALLHDIGKAGREDLYDGTHATLAYEIEHDDNDRITKITYGFDNEEHCKVGFDYVIGKQSYRTITGSNYDFKKLFHELDITENEQKLIAILIGIHFSFGNVNQKTMSFDQYLEKLKNLVEEADYNNGTIDAKLLQLAILIQVADVKGLYPCDKCHTHFVTEPVYICEAHMPPNTIPPFKRFGYYAEKIETAVPYKNMGKLIGHFLNKD
jgi:putative nucleotidyltransferase with HDIG domain